MFRKRVNGFLIKACRNWIRRGYPEGKNVQSPINNSYSGSTTRLLCESLLLFWGNFVARHRKRLAYQPKLCMFDNVKNKYVGPRSKVHIKYLGVLIDHNLSWKYHIDFIVTKLIKMLGYLQSMYKSLINPYLTYGLAAWGQACKTYLNKILILQKRAVFVLRGLA